MDFTVSPKPLAGTPKTHANAKNRNETFACLRWMSSDNPITHLYLKDWLEEYFRRINEDARSGTVPTQLKFQTVDLTSSLFLAADISGGASPFLGNGTTFIVPINGLTFDYNPDYQHKIDLSMKVCDNTPTIEGGENPCYPTIDTGNPNNVAVTEAVSRFFSFVPTVEQRETTAGC